MSLERIHPSGGQITDHHSSSLLRFSLILSLNDLYVNGPKENKNIAVGLDPRFQRIGNEETTRKTPGKKTMVRQQKGENYERNENDGEEEKNE